MIQVLDRAMRILEMMGANHQKEYTPSEIAKALSIDKGTCNRILKSLAERGFVQQQSCRGGYQIGYKLYHLTGKQVENSELVKIARKDIEDLGNILNETALLAVSYNDKRIVLFSTTPQRQMVICADIERPIYSVCAGRVILANYTPAHLEKCICRMGLPKKEEWPELYLSPNPSQELINELVQIKQNGYGLLDDKQGTIGFAAPIFHNGHILGSIGVCLPIIRLTDQDHIIQELLKCTAEINKKIAKLWV